MNTDEIEAKLADYRRSLEEEAKKEAARTTFKPEQVAALEKWRENYRRVFNEAGLQMLRVSESANLYCGDACCPHLPSVTIISQIGNISFWWRKRVAVINWEESQAKKTAHELFPDCKDTMGDFYVHCWDYDSVIKRLKAVVASVPPKETPAGEGT
jgi:hypothetical protein